MEVEFDSKMLLSFVFIVFFGVVMRLYNVLVLKPKRLRSILKKQGINGPAPTFLLGNITDIKKAQSSVVKATSANDSPLLHNCAALIFPFFELWRKEYDILIIIQIACISAICVFVI